VQIIGGEICKRGWENEKVSDEEKKEQSLHIVVGGKDQGAEKRGEGGK